MPYLIILLLLLLLFLFSFVSINLKKSEVRLAKKKQQFIELGFESLFVLLIFFLCKKYNLKTLYSQWNP